MAVYFKTYRAAVDADTISTKNISMFINQLLGGLL
jgi:hypothetical protein